MGFSPSASETAGKARQTRIVSLAALVWLVMLPAPCVSQLPELEVAAAEDGLSALSVFSPHGPAGLFFRLPENLSRNEFEIWEASFDRLDGIVTKTRLEELANLAPDIGLYMRQLAAAHDDQLVMLHFNGNAMDPYFEPAQQLSAAHWLYLPGSGLTRDFGPGDTVLEVEDPKRFRFVVGLGGACKGDDLVLVPLGPDDEKLWHLAEHVTVTDIHLGRRELSVVRGNFGPPSTAVFEAGRTYVAPHAHGGPWGGATNNLLWQYNFSAADRNGRTTGEALAAELGAWLGSAEGAGFHGVQLDIAVWTKENRFFAGREVDIDTDGVADGGVIAGRNVYGQGVYDFYRDLRQALGSERLIVADGGAADSQRAVAWLNGMEAEGFSRFDDPLLGGWSSAVNRQLYWQQNVVHTPKLSYVAHKDTTSARPPIHLTRLVHAASQALLLPVADLVVPPAPDRGHLIGIWDELRKGEEELERWLGPPRVTPRQPGGALQRLARDAPDLLSGAGVAPTPSFAASWQSSDANVRALLGELTVEASGADESMTIVLPDLEIGFGDLTVFFEIRSGGPLDGFPADVPRSILVRAKNQSPDASSASELQTYAGVSPFASGFYFRDAGPATIDLEIEIEGVAPVFLRNFTIHAAADALAREFSRGVVLANPSSTAMEFDLSTLFPGTGLRRLLGDRLQDPVVNNGSPVGNTVTLGPRDGLFLVNTAEPTTAFDADVTGGTETLTVRFTDRSSGDPPPGEWWWRFGDGGTSREQHPVHTYSQTGYYTVKLTTRNGGGRHARVAEGLIVIGEESLFRAADGYVPGVQGTRGWRFLGFDGTAYHELDWVGNRWQWQPESESRFTRIFADRDHPDQIASARAWTSPANGSVHITGRVKKVNTGGGDGVVASVLIGDRLLWQKPVAFDDAAGEPIDLQVPVRQGQTIYFRLDQNQNPGWDATAWQDLEVTLTALDLPATDFDPPAETRGEPPFVARFINRTVSDSRAGPVRYSWDFDGDGTIDSWRQNPPPFVYHRPGVYSVHLFAENDAGIREAILTDGITVEEPPSRTWNANADFGPVQGENQWLYFEQPGNGGYRALAGCGSHWQGNTHWTRIFGSYLHPDVLPAVRAWESPWEGRATITGRIRKAESSGCGDGVRASILHGDELLFGPVDIARDDLAGQTFDLERDVAFGDRIYFKLEMKGNPSCDASTFEPEITLWRHEP